MKLLQTAVRSRNGFTLLEVVVALTVLPIAALLVYQGMSGGVRATVEGVFFGQRSATVQAEMELVTRRYKRGLAAGSFSLESFKNDLQTDSSLKTLYSASYLDANMAITNTRTHLLRVELRDGTHPLIGVYSE